MLVSVKVVSGRLVPPSIIQRGEHTRIYKFCYKCLPPGHQTRDCRSVARCRSCGGKHHTMVHRDQPAAAPVANNVCPMSCQLPIRLHSVIAQQPYDDEPSTCQGPGWGQMVARALLDSGASLSLVSNRVPQTLQL